MQGQPEPYTSTLNSDTLYMLKDEMTIIGKPNSIDILLYNYIVNYMITNSAKYFRVGNHSLFIYDPIICRRDSVHLRPEAVTSSVQPLRVNPRGAFIIRGHSGAVKPGR